MWPAGIPRRRRFIPPPAATTEVKTKVELPRDRARRQRLEIIVACGRRQISEGDACVELAQQVGRDVQRLKWNAQGPKWDVEPAENPNVDRLPWHPKPLFDVLDDLLAPDGLQLSPR